MGFSRHVIMVVNSPQPQVCPQIHSSVTHSGNRIINPDLSVFLSFLPCFLISSCVLPRIPKPTPQVNYLHSHLCFNIYFGCNWNRKQMFSKYFFFWLIVNQWWWLLLKKRELNWDVWKWRELVSAFVFTSFLSYQFLC